MTDRAMSGRKKEASVIHEANRAAAVGRLMLGELKHWHEFLEADSIELMSLPRRKLKSGKTYVQKRLSSEVRKFCDRNFQSMTLRKLSIMYEEIKALRGLEMPLHEFEKKYSPVLSRVLRGNPAHLTVSISLWGFKLRFPEDELAKDISESLALLDAAQACLDEYEGQSHEHVRSYTENVQFLLRRKLFSARAGLIACFNLVEAYLNGLAWDFMQSTEATDLSNSCRKLLVGTASVSIREKLLKYPEIIAGRSPWSVLDGEVEGFLNTVKPFRDSLVHPSPFAAPTKFGGYDKLRLLYRIDADTAHMGAALVASLLVRMHKHIHGDESPLPPWLMDLSCRHGRTTKGGIEEMQPKKHSS